MSFVYSTQDEVAQQLLPLLDENASKVRLVLKYHHGKKEMTVRATDDVVCLKYKTKQHKDIYDTERLLQSAMAKMCDLSVEDITRQREKLSGGHGGGKKKKKKASKS
mmetsp:Transcript_10351/g.10430  ORF Transcript_10351/g.10430 Transcript_10351/m.10430 type:complete len:107 (+) Transcript_10351:246-566(+)